MKIACYGRGNIGGGLGKLWEAAGHEVTLLGSEGGDVSAAELVLLAIPGGAVEGALDKVTGVEGKTVIDATNLWQVDPPTGFASNAEYVKSRTNGPVAKAFNINFATLFDRIGEARARPSNLWCGDEEAREAVERLTRDAGYDPVCAGPLRNAAMQEGFLPLVFAIKEAEGEPFFYRMAQPEDL